MSERDISEDLDALEQQLRIEQMQTNILKMRADLRSESRKIALQAFVAAAALIGAGAALGTYLANRPAPPPVPFAVYLVPVPAPRAIP